MAEHRRGEKDEKGEEKQEEKGRGALWRRDSLSTIVWAAILIWIGVVLLIDNLGLLGSLGLAQGFSWIFIGAGVILLGEVVIRWLVPAYRRPLLGRLILALVLISIGLGPVINWLVVGPAILIALGIVILLRALTGRR